MQVPINQFKIALANGQSQIGLWQAFASPITAELCAGSGYDWLLFDGEHGPNDVPSLLAQLQAVASYPSHAVGRIPVADVRIIKQYLDIGFQTLLIPMVETADQAQLMVRACRYPPNGLRGVGSGIVRASRFGRVADYLHTADDQVCLLLQVETQLGLENLDAIARTTGVDGVFIGPSDLSAALGFRGAPSHPHMQAVIEEAVGVIKEAGVAAGILTPDEHLAHHYLDLGCTFVAVGTDVGLLAKGVDGLLDKFRDDRGSATSSAGY